MNKRNDIVQCGFIGTRQIVCCKENKFSARFSKVLCEGAVSKKPNPPVRWGHFFSLYGNNLICCTNSQLNWPYHQWSNGWCSGIPTFRCSGLREWRFTTIRFSLRRHSYSGKFRINGCSLLQSKGHQTCNCALREGQWLFRIFFYSKTSTFLRLI